MRALAEYTGGVRWDDSFWSAHLFSGQFSHLLVCDDRLIVTTPVGAYDFPRSSVRRLVRRQSWPWRALRLPGGSLRIEHSVRDYPSYFLFSTWDINPLCDRLVSAGYSVQT